MPNLSDQALRDYIAKCRRIIPAMTESELETAERRNSDKRLLLCPLNEVQLSVPVRLGSYRCNLLTIMQEDDLTLNITRHPTDEKQTIARENIEFLNDDELRLMAERIEEIKADCSSSTPSKNAAPISSVDRPAICAAAVVSTASARTSPAPLLRDTSSATAAAAAADSPYMANPANWTPDKSPSAPTRSRYALFVEPRIENHLPVERKFDIAVLGQNRLHVLQMLDLYMTGQCNEHETASYANIRDRYRFKNIIINRRVVKCGTRHHMGGDKNYGVETRDLSYNHGVIILADMSKPFETLKTEIQEFFSVLERWSTCKTKPLIVGINNENTSDKKTETHLKQYTDSIGYSCVFANLSTGAGVSEAFRHMISAIYRSVVENTEVVFQDRYTSTPPSNNESGCNIM